MELLKNAAPVRCDPGAPNLPSYNLLHASFIARVLITLSLQLFLSTFRPRQLYIILSFGQKALAYVVEQGALRSFFY